MKLSPTMRSCVEYMRQHGGIWRHPGGFWAHEQWQLHAGPWFDAGTLNALVKRGVVRYTDWIDGRSGRFPVKAALAAEKQPAPTATVPESAHPAQSGMSLSGAGERRTGITP